MAEREGISQDKAIIVLPKRVLDMIDNSRGELGRVEFIELCLDSLLSGDGYVPGSSRRGWGPPADAVSREEFEEFKRGLKDLQRAYIDFLLSYALEPMSRPGAHDRLKQEIEKLLEDEWSETT